MIHWHELSEHEQVSVDEYIAGYTPWRDLTSAARRYLTTPADGPWWGTSYGEDE